MGYEKSTRQICTVLDVLGLEKQHGKFTLTNDHLCTDTQETLRYEKIVRKVSISEMPLSLTDCPSELL